MSKDYWSRVHSLSSRNERKESQTDMIDPIVGEKQPEPPVETKKRLTRKELVIRIGILCVVLIPLSSGIIFGVVPSLQALSGVQHLHNAEKLLVTLQKNPLNTQTI